VLHRFIVGRRAQHLDGAVIVGHHVLGAGVQGHFHHLVLAARLRLEARALPVAARLEHEAHRPERNARVIERAKRLRPQSGTKQRNGNQPRQNRL
jgi:hypothetical protein